MTILLSIDKLPFVGLCTIIPDFTAEAMLLVIFPLALVLTPVNVLESAVPIGLSLTEVALIVLTIREDLPAVAMGHVRLEVPLKLCSVRPNHNTHSVFDGGLVSQPSEIIQNPMECELKGGEAYHSPL
jgi:hypothetical protein